MTSKLDEVFKRVLNDTAIFDSPYDKNQRARIPKLFEGENWQELGKLFREKKKVEFEQMINERINEIKNQERNNDRWRKKQIDELERRSDYLKNAFSEKPYLLQQLFGTLSWYGLVKCKLPTMDNYGKIIERYEISIIEQFFIDKIKRARFPENLALERVLEYVKELLKSGVSPLETAYFIRKLNTLDKYWEVIEDENG